MPDLTSMLAAAWAEPAAQARQGLSRAQIVEAAIAVADVDGLGAVSMGKVAARLGFTAMSLYRHVHSKDELILLMQDAAVGTPPEADTTGGWRPQLERWTWDVLGRFRAHPWLLATISMFGPPATPHQLDWLERGLQALAHTPLSEPEKLNTMLLLDAHVFSDLQFAAFGAPTATDAADPAEFGAILAGLLDPERFPALCRAVDGGAFGVGPDPQAARDSDFAFGLDRILDGVEYLIRAREGGDPG